MPENAKTTVSSAKLMAVKLRLRGVKIDDVVRQTGLSAPTIIKSHKQFLAGGWDALADEKRGRQKGQGSALSLEDTTTVLNAMQQSQEQLWSCEQVADFVHSILGVSISGRSASHLCQQLGLLWEPWKLSDLVNTSGRRALKRASLSDDQSALYFGYCRTVELNYGSITQRKVQLAMQTPKHKRLWTLVDWPSEKWSLASLALLLDQVEATRKIKQPIRLVLVGLDISRSLYLQDWLTQQHQLGRLDLIAIKASHSLLPNN